jgi:hypothetical protein
MNGDERQIKRQKAKGKRQKCDGSLSLRTVVGEAARLLSRRIFAFCPLPIAF